MFLHYILSQSEESLMKKFFNAQQENSTKTDWTYQGKIDLQELEMKLGLDEIKNMSKNRFKTNIKKMIDNAALKK